MDAELFVLHLDGRRDLAEAVSRTRDNNLQFTENLGAKVIHLKGTNVVEATSLFAKENRITQAIFGSSALTGLKKYLYFWEITRFRSLAPHVDLQIVTPETP
jgi:two-component system sensor histidine kinase KdpD